MKLKGYNARRSTALGWRNGDPERDFDLDGSPVDSNHIVIVRIKDCELTEQNGRPVYIAKNAPSIPIGYGGTWYGYGPHELKTDGRQFGERWSWVYWTNRVYFVRDAQVYTARGYGDRIPYDWGEVRIDNKDELLDWLQKWHEIVNEAQHPETIVGKAEHIASHVRQLEKTDVISWNDAKRLAYWLFEIPRVDGIKINQAHRMIETARWLIAEAEQQRIALYVTHDKSWPNTTVYGF